MDHRCMGEMDIQNGIVQLYHDNHPDLELCNHSGALCRHANNYKC